ncbi:hypothetical protein HanXRQr2_Chr14g0623991 [Helianthus annuus]|uniref:Uncharacterized protein n=1 Tax=Helianthus annuus TaxID=4232 RepID=A0A9K3E5N3_HELAN|nr:hypothetical protein HanXRQr2_Chr14g0623991 [Helianthus annuus]KAJ0838777.1 hypothetical protein HanPSC8_Chr14g0598811 [Helianthus annuus]
MVRLFVDINNISIIIFLNQLVVCLLFLNKTLVLLEFFALVSFFFFFVEYAFFTLNGQRRML